MVAAIIRLMASIFWHPPSARRQPVFDIRPTRGKNRKTAKAFFFNNFLIGFML
jgi:hypothetical protein